MSLDIEKINEFKILDLKNFCKENNIYIKSTLKKSEIIDAINEWKNGAQQTEVRPRGRGRPTGVSTKLKPKRKDDELKLETEPENVVMEMKEEKEEKEKKPKKPVGRPKKESKSKKSELGDENSILTENDSNNPADEKSNVGEVKKIRGRTKKGIINESDEVVEEPESETKRKSPEPVSNRALSPERIDSKSIRSIRGRENNSYELKEGFNVKIESEFEKIRKIAPSEFEYKISDEFKYFKNAIITDVKDYSFDSILYLFQLSSYILQTCSNEVDFHVMNSFYAKMKMSPNTILEKALNRIKTGHLDDIYFDLCYRLGYVTLNANYVRNALQFKRNISQKFQIQIEEDKKINEMDSSIVYMSCLDENVSEKRRETYYENHIKNNMRDFCECNELLPRDVSFETIYEHFDMITSKYRNESNFNTEITLVFQLGIEKMESVFSELKDVMECGILTCKEFEEKIHFTDHKIQSKTHYDANSMFLYVRCIRPYSVFSDGRILPNRFKLGKYVINFNNCVLTN